MINDDNKSKYSSNLKDILKSPKKTYEKSSSQTSIATTTEFHNRKKISNEHLIFVRRKCL